jgi:hypothetical protein
MGLIYFVPYITFHFSNSRLAFNFEIDVTENGRVDAFISSRLFHLIISILSVEPSETVSMRYPSHWATATDFRKPISEPSSLTQRWLDDTAYEDQS